MKKLVVKKLRLEKESLRALTLDRLEGVAGGINTTSDGQSCRTCLVGCPSVVC